MRIFSKFNSEVKKIILRGGVGVIPTDTIYGIVGSTLLRRVVERIYRLRKRRPHKPMIILIGSLKDLKIFDVRVDGETRQLLKELWPGKVSVILSCRSKKFFYLHRGKGTLAFRLPAKKDLRAFLRKAGPLVAPSANLEGRPSAKTIKEAQHYFGTKVDFYVDCGKLVSKPSTLIELKEGKIVVLRKGTALTKR